MDIFDETTGLNDRWRQDVTFDIEDSIMRAPSEDSDTNETTGLVPIAIQQDTQAWPSQSRQTTSAFLMEDNEREQMLPGLANSTITGEQCGPEQLAPQYASASSSCMECAGLDNQTSGQHDCVRAFRRLAPQTHRTTTKDFQPGQDGMRIADSAFKRDSFAGLELFYGARHIDIQGIEFFIQNHPPSANAEVLSTLENPIGTSWDPARACLPGTRANIIQDAVKWLSTVPTTGTAELYVVADAIGTGKSSLAHAVAKEVHDAGYLAASFFFNKLTTEFSTTQHLFGALVRGLCSANEQARAVAVGILRADSTLAAAAPTRQFDYLFLPICQAFPQGLPLAIVIDALDEGFDQDLMAIFQDRIPHLPPIVRIMVTTRLDDRIMRYLDPARRPHIHRCPYPLSGASNSGDVEQYIEHELLGVRELALTPQLRMDFVRGSNGLFLWATAVLKHLQDAHDPVAELTQILDAGGSEYWQSDTGKMLDNLFHGVVANLNSKDSSFIFSYTRVVGVLVTAKEPLSANTIFELLSSEGVPLSLTKILNTASRLQSLLANFDPDSPKNPILFLHLAVRDYLTERAPPPFRLNVSEHHPVLLYAALRVIDQETNLDTFPFLGFSKDTKSPQPSFDEKQISPHLCYSYRFLIDHLVDSQPSDIQPAYIDLLGRVLTSKGRELLEITAVMKSPLDVRRLRNWALTVPRSHQAPLHIIHAADGDFGKALHDIGRWLLFHRMSPAALMPLTTYTEMCRLLSPRGLKSQHLYQGYLALSLNSLAQCQMELGDRNSGVVSINEALQIWRGLDASNWLKDTHGRVKYKLERLDIQLNLCDCLGIAEKYQEAVEAAKGLVEMGRQHASKNVNLYESYVILSLSALSQSLTKVNDDGPALAAAEEGLQIHRRLFATNPTEHETGLHDSLGLFCDCLLKLEKYQEAVGVVKELVELGCQLATKYPNPYEDYLAGNLLALSESLTKVDDHGPALAAAEESLQIRRRLFATDPAMHERSLHHILVIFCHCLLKLEKHQEAVGAVKELVELNCQLATKYPNPYEDYLAGNLMALSKSLTKVDDHGPALAAAQEGLQIRRRLFATDPAKHEKLLYRDLIVVYLCLARVEKHQEAVGAAKELVELGGQLASKYPNPYEHYLAGNLMVLSESLTKVDDHGSALAAAEEGLQIRRRLFATNPAKHEEGLHRNLSIFCDCLIDLEKHQEAVGAVKELVELGRQLASKYPNPYEHYLAGNLMVLSESLTKVDDHGSALAAAEEGLQIHRRLFAINPTEHEKGLYDNIAIFCDCLLKLEKYQEAVGAAKELVELGGQLASKYPNPYEHYLAGNLMVLSEYLTKVNDLPTALVTVQEAVALCHNLSYQDKAKHKATLEDSLALQHEILSKLGELRGDSSESATAIPEADIEMMSIDELDYY